MNEITHNYGYPGIDQLIYSGFYPRIYDQKLQPTQALADYFETYVERYLRQLRQIKNLSSFQKFVKLCAGRTGQLLNLNSLGNDVGVSHTTAREWLTILEASYIVFLLEPFHRNIKKRLIKSPKIYFYDVGLAGYLLGIENLSQLETHPLRGNLFENMVVMEILKYRYNQSKKNNLNFYRDSIGNEVDVIYSLGADILPIEIKAAETIARDFFKGFYALDKIIKNMPYGKRIVYGGEQGQTRTDIRIITITEISDMLDEIDI
jgi:predicted AAA+ superfamily ATPase